VRLGTAARDYARSTFTRDQFSGKFYRKALELRDSPSAVQFPLSLLPPLQMAIKTAFRVGETLKAEKAALEKSLAKSERRESDVSAKLDERSALLAETQARLAALEATAMEADRRAAALGTALDEHAALLADAESRLASAQASLADAGHKMAEFERLLDERTVLLAEARDRTTELNAVSPL
jgi:chromosome segregation ATPase